MRHKVYFLLSLFLCGALAISGLYAAGSEEGTQNSSGGGAITNATDIIKIAGAYTVKESWLNPKTASEMGITSYNESPALAALVQSGDLPPVEDRLPDDPMVIEPYNSVGSYGGEIRVARTSPGDWGDMHRGAKVMLFRADPTLNEIIPFGARGYELSADRRTLTFHLYKGHKWSDGKPFTTKDFMWVYNNIFLNDKITTQERHWSNGGELSKWKAIDDETLEIKFKEPLTPAVLTPLMNWHRARQGNIFIPAHYAEQYHIDFNPKAEDVAKSEGYDNWVAGFKAHIDVSPKQPFVFPKIGAWLLESRDSSGKVEVRNPYFHAVDTEGNQLPYIDKVVSTYFADKEVAILNMMQGKIDLGGRLMNPASFALYKENEEIGGYQLREWQDTKTSRIIFMPNMNSTDPVKGPIIGDKRFRQALSLGLNRSEINEFVFLGLATPAQYTTDAGATFFDPSWRESYAKYDPAGAKSILDGMGMKDTNGDGWRETPSGEQFVLDLRPHTSSVLGTMGDAISELARDYWQELGIKVSYKLIGQELGDELKQGNALDIVIFVAEMYMPARLSSPPAFGVDTIVYSTEWKSWYDHKAWIAGGRQGDEPAAGIEPPAEWKQWLDDWHDWVVAPDQAEFDRLGKAVWSFQAEQLPVIGTVANAVRPIIINNRIQNVPEKLPFSFESFLWVQTLPSQWYIKE